MAFLPEIGNWSERDSSLIKSELSEEEVKENDD
jgi:hypothetical protein